MDAHYKRSLKIKSASILALRTLKEVPEGSGHVSCTFLPGGSGEARLCFKYEPQLGYAIGSVPSMVDSP